MRRWLAGEDSAEGASARALPGYAPGTAGQSWDTGGRRRGACQEFVLVRRPVLGG